jgi:prepilin-type N-terminal cleavage/methylation domain-containing protein
MIKHRTGFTLWELTMVLLIMAIAASLAVPAFARLGSEQPTTGADAMLSLLREARVAAVKFNTTSTLRIDPKTLKFELDTSGVNGYGPVAKGKLDLGMTQSFAVDKPRLQYIFRPNGAAIADTAVLRGGDVPLIVRVDLWSGVARADSR